MKRRWLFPILLPVLACVAGCPFEAKVPLGNPSQGSADPRLLGAWSDTKAGRVDSTQILVFPFNDGEYYVEVIEKNGSRDRYRAFPISVGGQQFLQINELKHEASPDGFIFARYSLAPDGALSLRFVGEQIVPKSLQSDPQGLADFISSHLDDPALDDEDSNTQLRRSPHDGGSKE